MIVVLAMVAALLFAGAVACLWQAVTPPAAPLQRRIQALYEPTIEHHAMVKLGFAVGGAAVPVGFGVLWRLSGVNMTVSAVALLSGLLATGGFLYPDLNLRRRATQRRRDFRYALSLVLELTVITIAGGAGVHEALRKAAEAGTGWAFQELRRALTTAWLEAESPWRALNQLGQRIGSAELVELASSVELAGTKGAPPGESLRAKAASVRDHELNDMKADAIEASERMGGPMIAMFVGLILLVGYPSAVQIIGL
jgi:Flp pilus assembly protein TadB